MKIGTKKKERCSVFRDKPIVRLPKGNIVVCCEMEEERPSLPKAGRLAMCGDVHMHAYWFSHWGDDKARIEFSILDRAAYPTSDDVYTTLIPLDSLEDLRSVVNWAAEYYPEIERWTSPFRKTRP